MAVADAHAAFLDEDYLRGRQLAGGRMVGRCHWIEPREGGAGVTVLRGLEGSGSARVEKYFVPTATMPAASAEGDVVSFALGADGLTDLVRIGRCNQQHVAQIRSIGAESVDVSVGDHTTIQISWPALPEGTALEDFVAFEAGGAASDVNVVCKGSPHIRAGDCPVCFTSKPVALLCPSHSACLECFQGYILATMHDQAQYPLKCLMPGCEEVIDIFGTVRRIVTDTDMRSIVQFSVASALGGQLVARCINCGSVQYCSSSRPNCAGHCENCGVVFCARCGTCEHNHLYQTCEAYQHALQQASRDGTAELEAEAGRMGWRRCPRCTILIEKTTGCNHMTHRNCPQPYAGTQTEFCYCCGVLLRDSSHTVDGQSHFPRGVFFPC